MSSQVPDGATLMAKRKKFFLHDISSAGFSRGSASLVFPARDTVARDSEVDPELGEKLSSKDVKVVQMLMMQRSFKGHKSQWTRRRRKTLYSQILDTAERSKRSQRCKSVQEVNRLHDIVMEENPESFAQVYAVRQPRGEQCASRSLRRQWGANDHHERSNC